MSDKTSLQKDVEQRFREFLLAHELRQTRERFAILEAIYCIEGTFTIEHLQELMQERRFPVSTGTLYSTLQLLIQANLLIRHPFNFSSVFERVADNHPRSYQICNNCHRITRIKQGACRQPGDLPSAWFLHQPPYRVRLWHLSKLSAGDSETAQNE